MGLLDDAIHAPDALRRVAALRRRSLDLALAAALVGGAGAAASALGNAQLGVAALIAAATGCGAAALARSERRRVLTCLVAAGVQEGEARAFAAELVSPTLRRRLARGLERAAAAGRPGLHEFTHMRPERARAFHGELLALASAFADPARSVDAVSAALCRRLLCEPTVSPLYNPGVADQELERTLRAIERGVGTPR
jgi:hypothetical protein